MSRQLTCFQFEIGFAEMVQATDGRYDMVHTMVTMIEDSSCTKSDARKAIKDAGVECKRGADVYFKKVGKVQYKFTTEALKSIAEERIELPLD